MTREDYQKEFIKNLSTLIEDYEKNAGEEIDLEFAFFDDDLDKKYYWENEGFEYREDIEALFNERNHENEMTISRKALRDLLGTIDEPQKPNSLFDKNIVHIHKNMGDWVKLQKNEIGLKIVDKEN